MKIAIVGHEEAKFTKMGKHQALLHIERILLLPHFNEEGPDYDNHLISGGCHLGGVDIWAEQVADSRQIPKTIFKPQRLTWKSKDGQMGFEERNIEIAFNCDVLYCLAVTRLANSFKGMTHTMCYHCHTTDHVKGGGCWTMKKAKSFGRETHLIIIPNEED